MSSNFGYERVSTKDSSAGFGSTQEEDWSEQVSSALRLSVETIDGSNDELVYDTQSRFAIIRFSLSKISFLPQFCILLSISGVLLLSLFASLLSSEYPYLKMGKREPMSVYVSSVNQAAIVYFVLALVIFVYVIGIGSYKLSISRRNLRIS